MPQLVESPQRAAQPAFHMKVLWPEDIDKWFLTHGLQATCCLRDPLILLIAIGS